MTGRNQFEFEETKRRIMAQRMVCEVCGAPGTQLAHRIAQTKHNLQAYGKEIVHSDKNLALVCSLKCNVEVNIEHDPLEKWRLIKEIQRGSDD